MRCHICRKIWIPLCEISDESYINVYADVALRSSQRHASSFDELKLYSHGETDDVP